MGLGLGVRLRGRYRTIDGSRTVIASRRSKGARCGGSCSPGEIWVRYRRGVGEIWARCRQDGAVRRALRAVLEGAQVTAFFLSAPIT